MNKRISTFGNMRNRRNTFRASRVHAYVMSAVVALLVTSGCALRVEVAELDLANSDMLATVASLTVKGKAPATGYSRSQFGRAWTDDVDVRFGHNGCKQNEDMMRHSLANIATVPGSRCKIASGTLNPDPYTGAVLNYTRGQRPTLVNLDHVVALRNAWVTGAQQWSKQKRTNFAGDPDNVILVSSTANQSKGARDLSAWEPPNKQFRCTYAQQITKLKARYGLWVTAAERDALTRVLGRC